MGLGDHSNQPGEMESSLVSQKSHSHTRRQLKVLFVYPNLYMMNMMPPSIAIFSALLKQMGVETALFDTTYYPWDHGNPVVTGQGVGRFDMSSDKRKELTLQVRPFNLEERGIHPRTTDI